MTLGDIWLKTSVLTHTNGINGSAPNTTYPDTVMLIDINTWYQKIVSMIFESQDDSNFDDNRNSNYPIVTTPLVAGQRDYPIPVTEEVLKIKRVDVSYDGVNYYRARQMDSGMPDWGMGNTTTEDENFIYNAPYYSIKYNSIFLYPMLLTATSGATLRIEWERAVIPFSKTNDYSGTTMSASTTVPGIDLPWHPMLAYGAAYEFANANNLPQLENIKNDLQDWEARLRIAYGHKALDEMLYLKPAYDAYGDYGGTGIGGDYYGR